MKRILSAFFFTFLFFSYAFCYGANYKLICDDLDQTGGKASSTNFSLMVSAGGQSSPIGISSSSQFSLLAGYVYATSIQRGDVNGDQVVDIGDIVFVINYVFYGGAEPVPLEAGDVNCDGIVDIGDIVYLINYVFYGGPEPSCG